MPTLPTYDSTKVNSLSLTPDQTGFDNTSSWFLTGIPITVTSSRTVGIGLDFSITNESEQGLALAPRIPFTAATNDLAGTGETAQTWDLTLTTDETSLAGVGTVVLYGVVSPAPSAFSSSNLPSTLLTTTGSTFLIETATTSSSSWSIPSSVYVLTFNMDFLTNLAETVAGATLTAPLHGIVNDPTWSGLVQFILTVSTGTTAITAATFAGNTHAWHTGSSDFDPKKRGRVVHDYITGQTYLSTEAVPDGFRDGIMVHPDNYDPPDPLDTNSYTPPPTEGIVDDEIIDVEN